MDKSVTVYSRREILETGGGAERPSRAEGIAAYQPAPTLISGNKQFPDTFQLQTFSFIVEERAQALRFLISPGPLWI